MLLIDRGIGLFRSGIGEIELSANSTYLLIYSCSIGGPEKDEKDYIKGICR